MAWSDTRPPLECYDYGTVAFRDFATPPVVSFLSPRSRNAEPRSLQDPWTRVPQVNGYDHVGKSRIAIPVCKSFLPLENPMLQMPTRPDLLPRVLPRSTVEILFSGFHDLSCPMSLVLGNSDFPMCQMPMVLDL